MLNNEEQERERKEGENNFFDLFMCTKKVIYSQNPNKKGMGKL